MEPTARYVIQGTLKYSTKDGEVAEAQFIEMNAPTGKHARQVAQLRQGIVKAIVEDGERNPPEYEVVDPRDAKSESTIEEQVIPGLDIINIVARSSVDLGDMYKVARELFVLRGVLRVDGEIAMTQTLLDGMTAFDFETLVGDYIANFTLPS